MHLSFMGQPVITKTCLTFQSRASICGQTTEWSDVHRAIRFAGKSVKVFTEVEYQLFSLLVEKHLQQETSREAAREVTYTEIAAKVFGCPFYEELLPVVRKRVSAIRRKVSDFGIDIISVPHRGYEIRDLSSLNLPYRRGHRSAGVSSRVANR